jgi:hypothetical protein
VNTAIPSGLQNRGGNASGYGAAVSGPSTRSRESKSVDASKRIRGKSTDRGNLDQSQLLPALCIVQIFDTSKDTKLEKIARHFSHRER